MIALIVTQVNIGHPVLVMMLPERMKTDPAHLALLVAQANIGPRLVLNKQMDNAPIVQCVVLGNTDPVAVNSMMIQFAPLVHALQFNKKLVVAVELASGTVVLKIRFARYVQFAVESLQQRLKMYFKK